MKKYKWKPKKVEKERFYGLKIPPKLWNALETEARNQGRLRSKLVFDAIDLYLTRNT